MQNWLASWLGPNWKSTVAGILSAILGTTGPVSGFLGALQAMKPTPDYTIALWIAGTACVAGILRVWIGMISGDAPLLQAPPRGKV